MFQVMSIYIVTSELKHAFVCYYVYKFFVLLRLHAHHKWTAVDDLKEQITRFCVYRLSKRWTSTWFWPRVRNWSVWCWAAVATLCFPHVTVTTVVVSSFTNCGCSSSRMEMTSAGTMTCLAASGAQRWGQVGAAHDRSHNTHSRQCQWKLAIACVCVRLQSEGG